MSRRAAGIVVAVAGIVVLSAVMVPARRDLSIATSALVLVVPVVAGVAVGGLAAGLVAVVAGFLAYDLLFTPPYDTLSVGRAQNWVALGVYVVVMLVVARVVVFLQRARADARRQADATRRLYLLSDLLIGDKPVGELLQQVVSTVQEAFGPRWVAALLPDDGGKGSAVGGGNKDGSGKDGAVGGGKDGGGGLAVAATAGQPLSAGELAGLAPVPGRTARVRPEGSGESVVRVALTARGRPVGMLALASPPLQPHQWELLQTYANHAALALERSQLREQAMRAELLEEVDRLRDAMMGAVSHDLRTPLASVKTAVTTLRRSGADLNAADQDELLALIEEQSDTLDRLVDNLLDMTRIQAGALELRRDITTVADVVAGALRTSAAHAGPAVAVDLPADLPPVDVDQLLMERVLANLLENAARHNPEGRAVEITATAGEDRVAVAVVDHGPGVPAAERDRVFRMFNRVSGGGRAGLGLAIAKAFVEAHGQSVWVDDAPGGGARFVFTMPVAVLPADGAV
ncbi:MAG TPA: ATP-binding protein [Acidimicrobiales bacterium]|nr:ATP-binding protein [Acidimicrobiales bacterium]